MTKFKCDVCNITVPSEKWLEEHQKGSSHQKAVEKSEQLRELASKSVFLDGFKKTPATEESVGSALAAFGQVDRVILDKRAGKFAIVEFADASSVQAALQQKRMRIGQDKINLKPRQIDFQKHEEKFKPSEEAIKVDDLLKALDGLEVEDFQTSLQNFYNAYKRDALYIVDGFVPKLAAFVQQFFKDEIQFLTFGSTATGFATFDSDVDVCFVYKQKDGDRPENGLEAMVTSMDLLTLGVDELRTSKISQAAFDTLAKPDQVRLLTRIINEFRKETAIIEKLSGIPDARCPVIRFAALDTVNWTLKVPINFEISLNNLLGIRKSEVVKNALTDDLSLLLFVIRLWGRCFKLYNDPKEPTGHWTSYALSLIFVQFCQLKNLIGHVQICGDESIDGWPIQYEIVKVKPESFEPRTFLLEFFKFAATVFNEPTVLSVRNGRLYKVAEFKKAFGEKVADEFKVSLVNVQDPIELTHNVTATVSKHYLSQLRSRCMAVIYNLKSTTMLPIKSIFSEAVKKPTQTGTKSNEQPPTKRMKPS